MSKHMLMANNSTHGIAMTVEPGRYILKICSSLYHTKHLVVLVHSELWHGGVEVEMIAGKHNARFTQGYLELRDMKASRLSILFLPIWAHNAAG